MRERHRGKDVTGRLVRGYFDQGLGIVVYDSGYDAKIYYFESGCIVNARGGLSHILVPLRDLKKLKT